MKSNGLLILIFIIIFIIIGMSVFMPAQIVMVHHKPTSLNRYNLPIHLGGQRRIGNYGRWRIHRRHRRYR